MEAPPLSSSERKELRGIAQRLKPHVHIGRQGLSESVVSEIDMSLTRNGLIKIRFETDRPIIQQHSSDISNKLACEYLGGVGKVGIFFREMPEGSKT